MILGGAEDREQEKHARLKAERQAEYNQFLNAKKSVWEEKGVRVAKIIKHKADVPLPPHLRDAPEYYPPDGRESNNPIWGKESIQPSVKADKKKQYAAELAAQAREAAERKKREKAQSIAETRQLLAQAGEIEPDFPARQHFGPGQGDMAPYRSGYDNERGSYDNMPPPERYGGPPPDWGRGRGGPPPEEAYRGPRGGPPPADDDPYGPPSAMFPPHRQESFGGNAPPFDAPPPPQGRGRSPHRSYDAPAADVYGQYDGGRQYGGPPPVYDQPPHYPRGHMSPTRDRPELHGRQAGMVFGAGPSQSFIQRGVANQRKAAYRHELEEQMRAAAERKAREKQTEKEIEERQEREAMEAGFHVGFSNARGGGGAPLKDDAGNVITDLNHRKARNNFPAPGPEPDPQRRHVEYADEPPPGNMHQQHAPPSAMAPQSSENKPKPLGNFRSDHAYMLPSEMEARARKQRQMQEALQEQIDAKKRVKEEQKRREQEEEMREAQRLAREQEELKAAFERESENKKAKAAEDADEMRRLAEEAYVKAKAKKNHGRPSSTGERRSRPSSGNRGGAMEQPMPPSAPPRNYHQYEDGGPSYLPPPDFDHGDDYAAEDGGFRQRHPPPGLRAPPAARMSEAYDDGSYRPVTGGSGRTAAEMARLREEIAAQQAEMKRVVQQQMHGLTKQQEREIEDLRRRAEMAEAEVANMRRSGYQQSASGAPYGRRSASGGRRKWGDADSDAGGGSGNGFGMELPPHMPVMAAPSNPAGYVPNHRRVEQFRESTESAISLDASLAGDSRLIFPGAPPSRAGPRDGGSIRDLSISSLKPLSSSKKGPSANAGGRVSVESRPRSRLGTPVDVDGLLAKNQDRARFLDVLQETGESNRGGNSDALDEMLIKFVELEKAGKASAGKEATPDMSMSLAGDSEWIR